MKQKVSKTTLFALLTGIFTASLVVSNILAGRIWDVGILGITLAGGFFLFPLTYIINDLMAEVYGFEKFKKVIWLGFALNILFVGIYALLNSLPTPVYMADKAEAFQTVLGTTWRILLASMAAYVLGGLINGKIMDSMHRKHGEKGFKTRAIASTLAGEGVDSLIFTTIAFAFVLPLPTLIIMIFANTIFKTAYEVLCLPITERLANWAKSLPEHDKD